VVGPVTEAQPQPRVTALAPDPRRPGSVRVEVDGARFGTLPAEVAVAERLAVGVSLSEEQASRLGEAADLEAAYRTVLDALGRRAHARAELARRLVRRGHGRAAVDAALDRAQALGLLDDEAYAVHYVQTRAPRGRGPARLRRDLLTRGVDRALIERVLAAECPSGEAAVAVSLALATKRAAELGQLPRQVKRRRILAYLARRGFSGYDAMEVVAKAVP
jgi:regulatory protein